MTFDTSMNLSTGSLPVSSSNPSSPLLQAENHGLSYRPTFFLALLVVFLVYKVRKPLKGKLPPGPRPLPLVGNVFQLSDENWVTFTEWKYKYGPIVSLNLVGQTAVVLNTHKVAADILDRRSAITSDRPRLIVASELLTGGLLLVFGRYGDLWRRMRRAAHEGLYMHAAENYFAIQEREATLLVDGYLRKPEVWDEHLLRTAASQILAMVYDSAPIKNHEDLLIVRVNELVQRLVKSAYPGEHLVEFFPWMQKFPGWIARWKPWAEDWHRKDSELFLKYYKEVEVRVKAGDERPSFASTLVTKQNDYNFSDNQNAWLAGVMVSAGAETTAAVLSWFMLAMTLYPEVQRKCQEELDSVVGRHRLPSFADKDELPYIRATVKEILRWRPVDPIGLQHQSTADDFYDGYFIPKGTLLIANVWAMNRDPDVYGLDFDSFRPDRFLDENGQLSQPHPDTKGEGHVTYGFGRRICVGRHVANNTLYIDIACILWASTIEKARDENGKFLTYNDHANYKEGLVVRPKPFPIVMKPRFPEAQAIVDEAKARVLASAKATN